MQWRTVRISTLVVCAVLSYAASGCSGGGVSDSGLDAAGAGGATDASSVDARGGAADDHPQRDRRIARDDAVWVGHPATKFDGLGGGGVCPDCKPRVAEPLPLPRPGPAPFKSSAAEIAW